MQTNGSVTLKMEVVPLPNHYHFGKSDAGFLLQSGKFQLNETKKMQVNVNRKIHYNVNTSIENQAPIEHSQKCQIFLRTKRP